MVINIFDISTQQEQLFCTAQDHTITMEPPKFCSKSLRSLVRVCEHRLYLTKRCTIPWSG
ncbi:hypothetical protein FOPG_03769 [Fusarium oxysporum f. sp. conglutinans race 2 54008]|uniref:Uncharacterized protein n=1 Tax=Fusarium oxysporum f. sp. conglutinans race 2 54008 TaxID=1089457 RepID=X0I4L2_FUSOX|nr:hypothetical protein FOPG_03769 [Fusarium oxysporum f. sp. conglutinans race 2 54008]KAI8418914.1 hypothetical protein FOFC_01486 [Fusarium oxysporum]